VLVLGRRAGESIVITLPDERRIIVRLLTPQHGHQRIGIDAPADVRIARKELELEDGSNAL